MACCCAFLTSLLAASMTLGGTDNESNGAFTGLKYLSIILDRYSMSTRLPTAAHACIFA